MKGPLLLRKAGIADCVPSHEYLVCLRQNLLTFRCQAHQLLPLILLIDHPADQPLFLQLRQISGDPALVHVKMGAHILLGAAAPAQKIKDLPLQRLKSKSF